MDLSENAGESLLRVVELRVDPDHADQVEYLGQHRRNVFWLGVGQLVARIFQNRQELEVALRLIRPILHHSSTISQPHASVCLQTATGNPNRNSIQITI